MQSRMMMLCVSLAVLLFLSLMAPVSIATATGTAVEYTEADVLEFAAWMRTHNKVYTSDELITRLSIFLTKSAEINSHNAAYARGDKTFKMAHNHLSDLTPEEFAKIKGYNSPAAADAPSASWTASDWLTWWTNQQTSSSDSSSDSSSPALTSSHGGSGGSTTTTTTTSLPSTVDWRRNFSFNAIKNQGQCGSCWAFAAVASMEQSYTWKTGTLYSFSEQVYINCAANGADTCTHGGAPQDVFTYLLNSVPKKNPITEANYPYTATSNANSCAYSTATKVPITFSSYTQVISLSSSQTAAQKESALLTASASHPGIAVAIDASHSSFQSYSGGVYNEPLCGNSISSLDHAVSLIGYGTDPTHGNYWLLRNQWGTGWGESGYMRMARTGSNMCGVATDPSYISY